MKRYVRWLLPIGVCGAAVIFALYRLRAMNTDDFSQRLAAFAGPQATSLGTYYDWSPQLEERMADSYSQQKAFWARSNRKYMNVHNSSQRWNVSEGFVYTSSGDFYQFNWYPPTFLHDSRITVYEYGSVTVTTRSDGSRLLGFDEERRVDLPW